MALWPRGIIDKPMPARHTRFENSENNNENENGDGGYAPMTWIWTILILAGVLFLVKMAYVLTTAMALQHTQGALYVSTSGARIEAFLDAVSMKPGQLLVDLGCGDGRVLTGAYHRYGVRAVGYELNWMAYGRARLRCMGQKGVRLVRKNFWDADISAADVVFCYLFPDVLKRLAQKIRHEVKPGAMVVSCNFPLPGLTPKQVMRPEGLQHHDPIYIYRIEPIKK